MSWRTHPEDPTALDNICDSQEHRNFKVEVGGGGMCYYVCFRKQQTKGFLQAHPTYSPPPGSFCPPYSPLVHHSQAMLSPFFPPHLLTFLLCQPSKPLTKRQQVIASSYDATLPRKQVYIFTEVFQSHDFSKRSDHNCELLAPSLGIQ